VGPARAPADPAPAGIERAPVEHVAAIEAPSARGLVAQPSPAFPGKGVSRSDEAIAAAIAHLNPLPSVRQLKADHQLGNARAARIRAAALARCASAVTNPAAETPPAPEPRTETVAREGVRVLPILPIPLPTVTTPPSGRHLTAAPNPPDEEQPEAENPSHNKEDQEPEQITAST
jgi:hypothetical protein